MAHKQTIYFDMDGTIVNFYGVHNWLPMLRAYDETPYAIAPPKIDMRILARYLNRLRAKGHRIVIISWLSKEPRADFDERVIRAKRKWLKKHLNSVEFDEIHIIPYGVPKSTVARDFGILFDDEERNRAEWSMGVAYDEKNILEILKNLLTN